MSNRHQQLADTVVAAFQETLDEGTRDRLTEANLDELRRLIHDALSEELNNAAERLDALLRELRAEVEKPELEL